MSENGDSSRRRINWTLFWTAVGALATVLGLLAAIHVFPFSDSKGSENPVAKGLGGGNEEPGASSTPVGGTEISQTGEMLWSSEISLVGDEYYALDGLPIEPDDGYCGEGCITVESYPSEQALEAGNGIREWGGHGPPSYADCVRLLESGPALAISLIASTGSENLAVGGWACAYSSSGNILRLRYEGGTQDGANYRFTATSWIPPS